MKFLKILLGLCASAVAIFYIDNYVTHGYLFPVLVVFLLIHLMREKIKATKAKSNED